MNQGKVLTGRLKKSEERYVDRQYLWRAVDQDGDVIDILVQSRRDRGAAARFFWKLLKSTGQRAAASDHG